MIEQLRDFVTEVTPHWVYPVGWAYWIAFFILLEAWALLDRSPGDTFTEHVRPLIQSSSIGWFLGSAFLFWLVFHFLVEGR